MTKSSMTDEEAKRKRKAKKKAGKSGIVIKPQNKGSFTAWAKKKGLSMSKAISAGLKSKSPAIRKKANFARNARKWKK